MRNGIFYFLILIVLASCGNFRSGRPIPREELVPLLVDLHIADAYSVNSTITDIYGSLDSTLLYGSLLSRHGYTKEELFSTFDYYTKKPEELIDIYDEVFATLSRMAEESKAEFSLYSPPNTLEVWKPKRNRITVDGVNENYPDTFDVEIDSTGTYVLNFNIKLTDKDESMNPKVIAYFYQQGNNADTNRLYFEKIMLSKSRYAREYLRVMEVSDSSFNRFRLIIPFYENKNKNFYKDMDLYNVRLGILKQEKKKLEKEI